MAEAYCQGWCCYGAGWSAQQGQTIQIFVGLCESLGLVLAMVSLLNFFILFF